ncbi:MAG: ThuA domain-containing protein [Allomuricauda sp.]
MKFPKLSLLLVFCFIFQTNAQEPPATEKTEGVKMPELVLVFTKTSGYRHTSIEKGVQTLRELGRKHGFVALQTETGEDFNNQNLKNYRLVVFLNTTLDVLDENQQKAFENYIKNGGSYLGIHAASDTEYDWPWYGKLVGGYFVSHPEQQKAKIYVIDKNHPSTAHLEDVWVHFDEWYNFKDLNPDVHVLMKLDESSYQGGINGNNHPIAWYHEFDGGRVFYTGLGHTEAAYDDPDFRQHILGGIEWCLKRK